jgi:pyruvate/2-oxoglutarate dehydrogenase complex dihydrolipoamide acyltransferase (E2) component
MRNLLISTLLACILAGVAFAQTELAPASPSAPVEPAAAAQPAAAPSTAPAPVPAAAPSTAPAVTPAPAASPRGTFAPATSGQSFLEQELEAAAAELSSPQVGTMTAEDIEKITAHIALAAQKERYVQRIRNASLLLPGLGQFMTGDTLGGWLFVAWDVTVLGGTLVSAYFLLPANVQFGSLDYANSPLSRIASAWASNSLVSYIPVALVLAGGILLEAALSHVSANDAARRAEKNINEGKVTFRPSLELFDGRPGLGMDLLF